jgi:hypothetical protein
MVFLPNNQNNSESCLDWETGRRDYCRKRNRRQLMEVSMQQKWWFNLEWLVRKLMKSWHECLFDSLSDEQLILMNDRLYFRLRPFFSGDSCQNAIKATLQTLLWQLLLFDDFRVGIELKKKEIVCLSWGHDSHVISFHSRCPFMFFSTDLTHTFYWVSTLLWKRESVFAETRVDDFERERKS